MGLPIQPHDGYHRWGRYAPQLDAARIQIGETIPFRFRYVTANKSRVQMQGRIEYDSATLTIETYAALGWRAETHVFIDSDLFVIRSVSEQPDNSPARSRREIGRYVLDLEKVDNPWRARA